MQIITGGRVLGAGVGSEDPSARKAMIGVGVMINGVTPQVRVDEAEQTLH